MPVKTGAWPLEAIPFEQALTPVVESFLLKRRAFDCSRSAIRQLYDRIDECADRAHKEALLDLVTNQLGEFDCLTICTSAFIQNGVDEAHHSSGFGAHG